MENLSEVLPVVPITVYLPSLPIQEGFEYTGEFRHARKDEYCLRQFGKSWVVSLWSLPDESPDLRFILQKRKKWVPVTVELLASLIRTAGKATFRLGTGIEFTDVKVLSIYRSSCYALCVELDLGKTGLTNRFEVSELNYLVEN